ncbi:MAG: MFS transporter [Solirubrobacterales bacterium]|nr:MFS transporter [Solirubrobacterales bacterium]
MISLLRQPQLRRFFIAHGQSQLGTGAGYVALLLFAYQRLHSGWAVALVLLADFLPGILLSAYFGVLADRHSRQRLAIAAELVRGAAFVGLALSTSFSATVGLALLAGVGTALFRPALSAALPNLVSPADRSRATALYGLLQNLGVTLGPALCGLLLLFGPVRWVLIFNGATFLISALLLTGVRLDPVVQGEPAAQAGSRSAPPEGASSTWQTARDGLGCVRRQTGLATLMIIGSATVLCAAVINVAEPILAIGPLHAGKSGFSILITVYGLGLVAGSAYTSRLGGRISRLRGHLLIGVATLGGALLACAAAQNLTQALAPFALGGFANAIVITPMLRLLQELVAESYRGRVFGLWETCECTCFVVAFLAAGALLGLIGPRTIYVISGGLLVALAAFGWSAFKTPVRAAPASGAGIGEAVSVVKLAWGQDRKSPNTARRTGSHPVTCARLMQFGVLGPLLVQDARGPVTLASAKQRALLAILLLETPHVVPVERLVDELWGERPPPTASKALQVHVSQLRRTLGADQPIVTLPRGYALHIDRSELDLHRFDSLLAKARRLRTEGDLEGALAALQVALGLWRGPPLADVILLGPGAHEAIRLEGLCTVAQEERMELELARGAGAEVIPELEALIAGDPYREHMYGLLMLALYRAGRQADALDAFRRARQMLLDDLGLEPGPELVRLQAAILNHDSGLEEPMTMPAHGVLPVDVLQAHPETAPAPRAAIPRPAATILGREQELQDALRLLHRENVRLLTLTGPGGIGKTRLALELAAAYEGRTCFIELAAVTEPHRVIPTIASALAAPEATPSAVARTLGDQATVLFVDNFEQVLATAPAITELLETAPSLKLVITSRAPLRIGGEHELSVPPLAQASAVELFVERVQEQTPSFSPSPEDREYVAAICRRVDYLPLAIELAAARARVLAPKEILDRIGGRLDLLTDGRRDAPDRHRTLRATIAWSHDLLGPAERRLFAQLAAFPSGCTVEACEAVAGAPALDELSALVDHSLLGRDGSRFGMLETVREFAAERLDASGEADAVRRRQALWCLELARGAEQELGGPRQATWFARLDLEHENLRAAAAWAAAHDEPETVLGLGAALWRFWVARGAAADVRDDLTRALATGRGDRELRVRALNAAGVLAGEADDFAGARELFGEALELATEIADRRQTARTLMNLGVIELYTEDHEAALIRYEQAGDIWRELGDVRGQSRMCQNLAIAHEALGQVDRVTPLLEESIELARAAGDGMHLAQTLIELGKHLVFHRLGDSRTPELLREGLELSSALGERPHTIECFEVLAALCARTGTPVTGAELIGAAEAERERSGIDRKPDELPLFEATIRELVDELGREAYTRAVARGRGRDLDVAVALALKSTEREPRPARQKRSAAKHGLKVVARD